MTCHHPLLLPDPDLSFNCWGGNPCYLVLSAGSMKQLVLWTMTQWSACPPSHIWWYHDGPFVQESKSLSWNAPPLPTTYNTTHIQTPYCFANFISVEGHTDWITMTILMCKLWVLVTGCSGHTDLIENQTTTIPPKSAAEVIVTLVTP